MKFNLYLLATAPKASSWLSSTVIANPVRSFVLSPFAKRLKKKGHFMKKEYDFSKMKEIKNPYPRQKKKAVGINLSSAVINYFKDLSEETGVPYQKLIDLYLLDCVKNKKKLSMKWTA
jgi:hypothetical protein